MSRCDAFVPLSVLSLAALCAGCSGRAAVAVSASPSPPSVAAAYVTQATIHPSVQIAGVIAPYRQVAVTANLSEPISEVDVVEGAQVRAGQVLAKLLTDDLEAQLVSAQRMVGEDRAHYSQAVYQTTATTAQNSSGVASSRDALRQAEVNLAGAQTDLARYEQLASGGYLPTQTLDQQRVAVAADIQAVAAARASLVAAQANDAANGNGFNAGVQQQELQAAQSAVDAAQATVDQLRIEISRAVILAPAGGVVDSVNANPGEYPSGRQLFTIEQNDRVYAVLPASTAQVLSLRRGAAASVEVNTSYNANPVAHKDAGTVDAILDQVQPGTTNFTVKVLVDNADHHLRAGMPVTGYVDLPALNGLTIPLTAFVDDTRSTVFAVDGGIVHLKNVQTIGDDGVNAIVRGLGAGELVVKNVTAETVGNGDRVRATTSAAPAK